MDCEYTLEPRRRGGSNTYNLCFEQKYEKYQSFLSEIFRFLEVKFSIYLNRRVFVMMVTSILSTVLSRSLGKTFFAWHSILNENISF